MKARLIHLCLSLGGGWLLIVAVFLWGAKSPDPAAAFAPPNASSLFPSASFHLWQVNEIFSCADGTTQFVEMVTDSAGQNFLANHELRSTSGAQTHSFFFPFDMPNYTTPPDKYLLIATSGFAGLPGGITPDYTLTSTLIFTNGAAGSVSLVGALTSPLSYSAGQLPLDGINSLSVGNVVGANSPRNFAGQQGSIVCPLALNKTSAATVKSGDLITYTLTVTSSGTVSNTNVVLTDTIPANTTFVAASTGVSPVGGVLTWPLGTMATSGPTSVISRVFVVTTNAPGGTVIANTDYGVRSDQTREKGTRLQVSVVDFIYLPTILKDANSTSEHAADLQPDSSTK